LFKNANLFFYSQLDVGSAFPPAVYHRGDLEAKESEETMHKKDYHERNYDCVGCKIYLQRRKYLISQEVTHTTQFTAL